MRRTSLAAAILAVAGALAACGSKRDDVDGLRSGSDYTRESVRYDSDDYDVTLKVRKDFYDSVDSRVDSLNRRISELRTRVINSTQDERERLSELADDLSAEKDEFMSGLRDLRETISDEWDSARDSLTDSLESLERRIEDSLR